MIIRSQDKKQIVNFDVCHIGITRDNCVIAVNGLVASPSEILRGVIGKYSTEDKAVKVLDMICKAYENYRGGNFYEHSIFNMPQDSEV